MVHKGLTDFDGDARTNVTVFGAVSRCSATPECGLSANRLQAIVLKGAPIEVKGCDRQDFEGLSAIYVQIARARRSRRSTATTSYERGNADSQSVARLELGQMMHPKVTTTPPSGRYQ